MQSGLQQEGPDSAYISDIAKFERMKTWLDEYRALLLRSPPGSGKTSFAVCFTEYLVDNGASAIYLNASVPENHPGDGNSMNNVMERQIGDRFSPFCKTRATPFYLIVDEAQVWYPDNAKEGVKWQLTDFWAEVKAYVSSTMNWTHYTGALSQGTSKSDARSESRVEVRLLCLAGYGEASLGSVPTPQVFMDPSDTATGQVIPLGLDFLRFDSARTYQLITKFTKLKEVDGKLSSFANDQGVCDLIFKETNGHVGAIRSFLLHVINAGKTTKDDIIEFTSSSRFRTELTVYRPFLAVSERTLLRLSSEDKDLFLRCIASYKEGTRAFPANAAADGLIKLGIFVREQLTTMAFPSPLHFDIALHTILHLHVELKPTRSSFEAAIQEMVLRMNPKLLYDTPTGHQPYERQWEDECYDAFRSMTDAKMTRQVGREYNQRAFLDIYVNSLQWGIELIRLGGGKRLDKHVGRFSQQEGRYCAIPMTEYVVLNLTNKVPTQQILDLYDDHVWHLVYNDGYTKVTVYRKDKTEENWDLIGHQRRTEYD